ATRVPLSRAEGRRERRAGIRAGPGSLVTWRRRWLGSFPVCGRAGTLVLLWRLATPTGAAQGGADALPRRPAGTPCGTRSASPDLLYCAESLLDAFPDARLVQIIRDGRDVVAGMLADPDSLAWFRPGFVDLDAEFAHPVLGVETQADRAEWPGLSVAGKCAMR